jgi:hypothetical protein
VRRLPAGGTYQRGNGEGIGQRECAGHTPKSMWAFEEVVV